MTYQTRVILRRTLPVAFWLLALGGSIAVPLILQSFNPPIFKPSDNYWWGFLVAFILLLVLYIAKRLDRHQPSSQENFQMAVLLGVASYWLPTVVFVTIPMWFFCATRFAFNFRSFLATLLGYSAVAVHAALFVYLGWIHNVWADFFSPDYMWGWIPTGAIFLAWLGTTIVYKILRER